MSANDQPSNPSRAETSARQPTTQKPDFILQEGYRFPYHKLKRTPVQEGKTPLVLVACGSFSPVTYLHLRMFEMASDYVRFNTDDAYKKAGLAPDYHRVNMCAVAVEQSSWLMVDPFETAARNSKGEPIFVPTAEVLAHVDHEINDVLGGIGGKRARISLLAGSDLIQTMSTPNLWSPDDLDVILGSYGCFIIERSGTDIEEALASLRKYEDNIWVISQVIQNDISSTKVRLFLKKDLSVRYLIPDPVVAYIEEHGLFQDGSADSNKGKSASDKSCASSTAGSSKG
ncbi:hypothetical protein VTK73DRAFT_8774 [Phialemonium thermophilum]|uniref:Nicotinamide-nucleotide adenylyltransferase n=1 Tax=Phialemonium thermophilum TaxID=223376 RepID=A0ABR3XMV2_9PEZI